jgi:hypothetical protein
MARRVAAKRIPMMAMTMRSSIRVNPGRFAGVFISNGKGN